jgi:hypothetical protein
MFDIIFPQHTNQRYWEIHYKYVLNIFRYLKCDIQYQERPDFIVTINKKDFFFDYGDSSEVWKIDLPIFKFHCHEENNQVLDFPPVSFYNWEQYYQLEKEIKYNPYESNLISFRQKAYARSFERREHIQKVLVINFSKKLLSSIINQIDYWRDINRIKIAVFVPGWCNNMIDRGQLQYMGFGCCTISPNLPEKLPFNNNQCKDDYSDLIETLNNKSFEIWYTKIGKAAKSLFQKTCTPEAIGEWIGSKLNCI